MLRTRYDYITRALSMPHTPRSQHGCHTECVDRMDEEGESSCRAYRFDEHSSTCQLGRVLDVPEEDEEDYAETEEHINVWVFDDYTESPLGRCLIVLDQKYPSVEISRLISRLKDILVKFPSLVLLPM